MKYYWLTPKDQRYNNWLLYTESSSGVSLRPEYKDLACSKCGKLDELEAIERGISPDTTLRTSSDYLMTDDGFVCVSEALRETLTSSGVSNITYLTIAGKTDYFIALPSVVSATDKETCDIEFHRPCGECTRFRETCFFPALESLDIPTDALALVSPAISLESVRGRKFWFCASSDVVTILKASKSKGLDYTEAD